MTVMQTTGTYEGKTAAEWREMAAAEYKVQAESFEHCDNDGFMTQAASGMTANQYLAAADLAENGATTEAPAIFDLDGNLIPAKLVKGDYGYSWMLLDANGRCAGWLNRSKARGTEARIRNNAAKGFYEGRVKVEAKVDTRGWNAGIYPVHEEITAATVLEIVDNGH